MRKYISIGLVIAAASLALYPAANALAVKERGIDACGGEELLLIFGFLLAFLIPYIVWEIDSLRSEREKDQ